MAGYVKTQVETRNTDGFYGETASTVDFITKNDAFMDALTTFSDAAEALGCCGDDLAEYAPTDDD